MTSHNITIAEILEDFNKLKRKPYVSVKDLELSKAYKVISMSRQTTKYGDVVVAELEEKMVYLPKRYNNLKDGVIEGIAGKNFILSKKLENTFYVLELEENVLTVEDGNTAGEDFYCPNSQPFFSWETTKIPRIQ